MILHKKFLAQADARIVTDENSVAIHDLIKEKHAAHVQHLRNPSTSNKNNFSSVHSKVQNVLRDMKNSWCDQLSSEMQTQIDNVDLCNFYYSIKTAYGPTNTTLSPVRTADRNTLIPKHDKILDRWVEHFNEVLNRENPSILDEIPQLLVIEELDTILTLIEVVKAITSVKNHKAAGPDDIPVELLKYGCANIINHIHGLYKACWQCTSKFQGRKNRHYS